MPRLLLPEGLFSDEFHCVLEHRLQPFEVLLLIHGRGVARVAVCGRDGVADARDGHDDGVLAGHETILLHKAREACGFWPAAHAHGLHAGAVDLQAIAGALEVRAGVAHAVPDVHAVDGRTGEDVVHQLVADHGVRVGERRAIHGGGEVLHKVGDDHDVARVDVVAHAAGRRRDDQLPDAQLPQDPHEQVHRVAALLIHVDPTGKYEHLLSGDGGDADLPCVTGKVGETREVRMNIRQVDGALGQRHGVAPARAEHHGGIQAEAFRHSLDEMRCDAVENFVTIESLFQNALLRARKQYRKMRN